MLYDTTFLYILFYCGMAFLVYLYFRWRGRVERRNAAAFNNIMNDLEATVKELREARLAKEAKDKEALLDEARGEFIYCIKTGREKGRGKTCKRRTASFKGKGYNGFMCYRTKDIAKGTGRV